MNIMLAESNNSRLLCDGEQSMTSFKPALVVLQSTPLEQYIISASIERNLARACISARGVILSDDVIEAL